MGALGAHHRWKIDSTNNNNNGILRTPRNRPFLGAWAPTAVGVQSSSNDLVSPLASKGIGPSDNNNIERWTGSAGIRTDRMISSSNSCNNTLNRPVQQATAECA